MTNPILLVTLLAIVAAFTAEAAVTKGRKVPLTTVGSKTFYIVDDIDKTNWEDAKATCKNVGLVMAIVANKAESDALSAASLERAKQDKQHYIWLGAILRRSDQKWVWEANGQELTYTNWREGANLEDKGAAPDASGYYNCGYIDTSKEWGTWACGGGDGYEYGLPVCQEP